MRLIIVRLAKSDLSDHLNRFRTKGPIYLESFTTRNRNLIYKLFVDFNNWYTRILGLDEVKLYQDRVVALQEKLLQTQEQRREIGRHLAETRKKSNLLQDEIHKVKRQDDLEKFLTLMREETEVLKQEKEIAGTFQEYDQAERELFSAFSNSIRDSHEKQRAQLEYTKYFGIILSIAGSFLAFCYTSLTKYDLKNFIESVLEKKAIDKESFVLVLRDELSMIRKEQNDEKKLWWNFLQKNEKQVEIQEKQNWSKIRGLFAHEVEKKQESPNYLYIIGGSTIVAFILLRLING